MNPGNIPATAWSSLVSSSFKLAADYTPQGDQAQAIAKLVKSINAGNLHQTLLGVTGSGKTFTMANVIAQIGRRR